MRLVGISALFIFILFIIVGCTSPTTAIVTTLPEPAISNTSTAVSSPSPTERLEPTLEEITSVPPTQIISTEPPPAITTIPVLLGPDCAIGLPPTRPDMEGPYFLAGSPERASLIEPGMSGTPLVISGYVMTVDCKVMPGVKLDFWQADSNGEYDLQGYRLRGHVFTDKNGYYQVQTIIPAKYEPRPRHIHVMVVPPDQPSLTTQLYFPGDSPYPDLTIDLRENADGATAKFNFTLPNQ